MPRTRVTVVSKCPGCGVGVLQLRYSIGNDEYFLGCAKWRADGSGCSWTSAYDETIEEMGERIAELEREVATLRKGTW